MARSSPDRAKRHEPLLRRLTRAIEPAAERSCFYPHRLCWLRLLIGLACLAIVCHVIHIQTFARDYYLQFAATPTDKWHVVHGKRGCILDHLYRPLVISITAVNVKVAPSIFRRWAVADDGEAGDKAPQKPFDTNKHIRKAAQQVADDLGIEFEHVLERVCREKQEVALAWRVQADRTQRLQEHQRRLDQQTSEERERLGERRMRGLYFDYAEQREYPCGTLASAVLGHCDAFQVPRAGVHWSYRQITAGERAVVGELQAKGGRRILAGILGQQPRPERGADLVLAIDYPTQQIVESALDDCFAEQRPRGANIIVMSARDASILAMACRPTFNPNDTCHPGLRTPQDIVARMENRPVSLAMEPGSTFKLLTVAAGLEFGVITENTIFTCAGRELIGGDYVNCWGPWAKKGHGPLTVAQILQESCNIGAAKIALKIGAKRFCEFLTRCGIGQRPCAGFPKLAEATGVLRTPEKIVTRDLASLGFGQSVQVSDLQLITAVSAIMNGGVYYQPHIVKGSRDPKTGKTYEVPPCALRRVCSEKTSATMRRLARRVVEHGTGRNARIEGVAVGGKTATAQIFENGRPLEGEYVMSFVLIAPLDREPDFVVLVTVERPQVGRHGSDVAAPVARRIAQYLIRQPGLFRDRDADGPTTTPSAIQETADRGERISHAPSHIPFILYSNS